MDPQDPTDPENLEDPEDPGGPSDPRLDPNPLKIHNRHPKSATPRTCILADCLFLIVQIGSFMSLPGAC